MRAFFEEYGGVIFLIVFFMSKGTTFHTVRRK